MVALVVKDPAASKPANSPGETYARKVLSDWNGNHVADACIAATHLGLIHSGGGFGDERARQILREEFDSRKVDDVNWSVVIEAYRNGRSAVISPAQQRERFYPAAVNDNKPKPPSKLAQLDKARATTSTDELIAKLTKERFQVTWFDDVDQSTAKAEILHGVLASSHCSLPSQVPAKAFLSATSAAILRLASIGMGERLNKAWWYSSPPSGKS